jgi:hypothetical protein
MVIVHSYRNSLLGMVPLKKHIHERKRSKSTGTGGTAHRLRLEEGHGHGDNGDYHASAPAFEEIHPSAPPEVLVLNGGCRGDRIHVDTKR